MDDVVERNDMLIEKIIDFCARNKFLVILLTLCAMLIGFWAMKQVPLDAIPDLSDTQVVIYSKWDRSPDILEDQVTYPIVTSMLGAPRVKAVRGFSDFGFSYVYVIFQDGTDIYWARSRVLEYLSKIVPRLPEGVKTEMGPDATGVGWVYQYALVDESGKQDLQKLRTFQDWYLRYYLQSVPGVAEVASYGGFQKQYQVNIDPNKLLAYNIPLTRVIDSIRKGNNEVGGRLLEFAGAEYMVRGKGYVKSVQDIESIVVETKEKGTPILVKNLATVQVGPEIRRGIGDFNGQGDVVGGIVVMRYGENALNVINRVKEKIKEIEPGLPEGVKIVPTYDRSDLIKRAIETLTGTLRDEMIMVSLVILIFLLHIPSSLIPIITLPMAVVLCFVPLFLLKQSSNIMSLAGIAVAIGAMVDASIVVVENAHKKLERWDADGRKGDYKEVVIQAIKEVGPSSFYSLLVIAVSFIPVFTLEAQEGRLFKPLAWTKNLSIAIAAILAVTLDPAVRMLFTRLDFYSFRPKWLCSVVNHVVVGKMYPEEKHPISGFLFKIYHPIVLWVIDNRKKVIAGAIIAMLTTIPVFMKLGSEFMPPLNEGSVLYMPTTLPGISVTEAARLLQAQDQILKSFPEVETVHGKAGRVDSSTDPAPFSMMETVVTLKPESEWRGKSRWYSKWVPEWFKWPLRIFWPEHISYEELISEMDSKLQIPGTTNAWTMPIKNRIDMLSTGVRTPIGIKIFGSDLKTIEDIGTQVEKVVKGVNGTRSVFAERVAGGYFIDIKPKREEIARYGLSIEEVQMIITSAIGGENIATTIEGRERYSINARYSREFRDDVEKLKRVLVPTESGQHIPLIQVADIEVSSGPSMIRNENGLLAGYVYVDMTGRDVGTYVSEAKEAVRKEIELPTGYSIVWSGQYEYMQRVRERLFITVPLTLFVIFFLIFLNTKSWIKTGIVLLAVPFSLIGAIWFLWFLDYNMSVAVWVGMIALMGVDAETGIFMLLYLDLAYEERKKNGRMKTEQDLREAIIEGAVKRIRPKMMTVMVDFAGLLPVMLGLGAGSDVMKRIAAPLVGGLFTSFLMELLVYPAIYMIWRRRNLIKSPI